MNDQMLKTNGKEGENNVGEKMYKTAEKLEIGKWKDLQKIIDYLICNAGKAMAYIFYPTI